MKKFLTIAITILLINTTAQYANAKSIKSAVNKVFEEVNINKSAVAISIKEISNKKNTYGHLKDTPMNAASVQKIVTFIPSLETLGKDYEFTTKLYKNTDNDMIIKLGADPYLMTSDLSELMKKSPKQIKSFHIDDSIVDANEWGEGWQWDDDLNPLMPKFGAYNLDKNLLKITITPNSKKGAPADISVERNYPLSFMNLVTTGSPTRVKLERKNYISPDTITATGTVDKMVNINVPINHPRRYFIMRMEDIVASEKIEYWGDYKRKALPENDYKEIAKISHPISLAARDVLKNSNNTVSETTFKLAGNKYSTDSGSIENAFEMFADYCQKRNIDTQNIKLADASGTSKNNSLTADFITEFLIKSEFDKTYLPTAGEGTLKNRMLYLKDKVYAKTGTLTNVSAIAGFVTTRKGNEYVFCVITNDAKSTASNKKLFEDYLIRAIYTKL